MITPKVENEELFSKNYRRFGLDLNLFVSLLSAVLVLSFILFTIIFPTSSALFFSDIKLFVTEKFNWLFVFVINFSLLFILVLVLSKFGSIRIGGANTRREFSNFAWYSMLFSAGIGIGIFFFGIAEPIYHLNIPSSLSSNSIYDPFKIMYLHWGIHAWVVYSVVAIVLGYFAYNKGLPLSIRSVFYPVLKEKIYGFWGNIIDTIAVLSVLFGLSTSLGLGARQINAGLNFVFDIPFNNTVQLVLIAIITFIATLSVVSGISKGIKMLSELNVKLSFVFLGLILIIGPTVHILSVFFNSTSLYFADFFKIGLFTATSDNDINWQSAWTIFYWAWWFSWSPFVGMFIARISKGRTIRQIIIGTVFVPSLVCFFTMTILGATGLDINETYNGVMEAAVLNDLSTTLFVMINHLFSSNTLQVIFALFAVVVITLFFVTSSDSGSLIVDFLTSGGKTNTPKTQRVFWAVMEGLIAASVLVLGGVKALNTLQALVIIMGLPFSIMFLVMIYSLVKQLLIDNKKK
ncbi:hypothetical protein CI105_07440 [Candidatus Izimaplasma bacterium ZiA1]|uniref:BCCT family transporter n=1 Tax=Candidatus Izimoplasma sp. ZiA1 TaxID=2024899 RepID=UPI000BAA9381|nr:hypothetical protein CI105_07440 [Candidatus Izimaplasma bacterium ZiA1]